jgi:hypothetical protein
LRVALWNAGVILVPAGVLIGVRLPVVIGGLALLAALSLFARSARAARKAEPEPRRGLWAAQVALIAFMAASVLVGTALAWEKPWL